MLYSTPIPKPIETPTLPNAFLASKPKISKSEISAPIPTVQFLLILVSVVTISSLKSSGKPLNALLIVPTFIFHPKPVQDASWSVVTPPLYAILTGYPSMSNKGIL